MAWYTAFYRLLAKYVQSPELDVELHISQLKYQIVVLVSNIPQNMMTFAGIINVLRTKKKKISN